MVLRSIRTLLVDDSTAFLESVARLLAEDARIEIVGRAMSGHAALEQVAHLQPDLVLMDWRMPAMNGLETTRAIKTRADAPRVVVLTLNDGPTFREATELAGADGFVCKLELDGQLKPLIHSLFD